VVQLNDTVISSSTTQAATANSVKVTYDRASTALSTANSASTTAAAAIAAANLAQTIANAALPVTGGTMTGNITFAPTQTFPVAGIPDATTGTKGVVQLATNAEVQTGTDSTKAVVSSSLQSKLSDSISTTSSTTIASSTAVKAAYDIGAAAIPCAAITAKGAIITGTAASTPTALTVGTDGQVLTACAACASGLTWAVVGGGGGTHQATPLALGTVFGCTLSAANLSTAYGYCADFASSGSRTTAIGYEAGANEQGLSSCNTYVGHQSGFFNDGFNNTYVGALTNSALVFCSRNDNTLVGTSAGSILGSVINNNCNTLIGSYAGCALISQNNTFVGAYAGTTVTTGTGNLAIGSNVSVASPTGNNQLAIGWGNGATWLTGTNTGAIKPSAGIIDNTDSCGAAQQVLFSTGANAVVWCDLNQVTLPPNYACSISLATQTAAAINTAQTVTYNTPVFSSPQVIITPSSSFLSGVGGPYLVQFNAQLLNTVNAGSNVEFWLATVPSSGSTVYTAIPNTGRKVVVANAGETQLVNLSYQALLNTGLYVIVWATDDLNTQLVSSASTMGGPTTPSASVSIMPVGF
jgi:hypothetical protein